MSRLIAVCLAAGLLATGCSTGGGSPLQVSDTLVAARPAPSPEPAGEPAGTVRPAPPAREVAVDTVTGTVVLASADPAVLSLFDTTALRQPPRTIRLPAPAVSLRVTRDGGSVLVSMPEADAVARVDLRTGRVDRTEVPGAPVSAVRSQGMLVVARRDRHDVAVVDRGRIVRTIGGFQGPARLLHQGGEVLVLDTLTTSLTPVNITTGDKGAALRAGEGATHALLDRYGRALVLDTRGEEILAFSTDPLIMKQRYPVPGRPFGLAYDPVRDLAWVTLTQRNELVAYDIAGGQPAVKHRVPTVHQPNSVTVDPRTGKVYVASATGRGLQVVQP